jgi:hypothetical protein
MTIGFDLTKNSKNYEIPNHKKIKKNKKNERI